MYQNFLKYTDHTITHDFPCLLHCYDIIRIIGWISEKKDVIWLVYMFLLIYKPTFWSCRLLFHSYWDCCRLTFIYFFFGSQSTVDTTVFLYVKRSLVRILRCQHPNGLIFFVGVQNRTVECTRLDHTKSFVNEEVCKRKERKPERIQACNTSPCRAE